MLSRMNPHAGVDRSIREAPEYAKPILVALRRIIHAAVPDIVEELKWGAPAFAKRGLVCSVHAFRNHVGLWFHKGALLPDPQHLLEPGPKARTMKVIRLSSVDEIDESAYARLVRDAARLNDEGVKPPPQRHRVVVPTVLKKALAKSPKAKAFFDALAPSHRREYSEYVREAKKFETIQRRAAWTIAELEKGRRPHEKYRR